jgi:hypothetical protein
MKTVVILFMTICCIVAAYVIDQASYKISNLKRENEMLKNQIMVDSLFAAGQKNILINRAKRQLELTGDSNYYKQQLWKMKSLK